jgi:hypothetical protein
MDKKHMEIIAHRTSKLWIRQNNKANNDPFLAKEKPV